MIFEPFLTLSQQALVFTCLHNEPFAKAVGQGEIAHKKQFLLFRNGFLPFQRTFHHFHLIRNCSLPNKIWSLSNKILDLSKLEAFADDKINVTRKLKIVLGRTENNVGKGENTGYQHFLLFPQCFLKASFSRLSKVGIVW